MSQQVSGGLLRTPVDKPLSEAKEVSILLHHMAVQNELLNDENKGLRNVSEGGGVPLRHR
jgi:hypothetical protein